MPLELFQFNVKNATGAQNSFPVYLWFYVEFFTFQMSSKSTSSNALSLIESHFSSSVWQIFNLTIGYICLTGWLFQVVFVCLHCNFISRLIHFILSTLCLNNNQTQSKTYVMSSYTHSLAREWKSSAASFNNYILQYDKSYQKY